jgi:hypothetical protein
MEETSAWKCRRTIDLRRVLDGMIYVSHGIKTELRRVLDNMICGSRVLEGHQIDV